MTSFTCIRCGMICFGDYKETDTHCSECLSEMQIAQLRAELTAARDAIRRAWEMLPAPEFRNTLEGPDRIAVDKVDAILKAFLPPPDSGMAAVVTKLPRDEIEQFAALTRRLQGI